MSLHSTPNLTLLNDLGLGDEVHPLKLGKSFSTLSSSSSNSSNATSSSNSFKVSADAFHTLKYDFKPLSVDTSKEAAIQFGEGNSVTVSVANVEGSEHTKTKYSGSRKPHLKECVLIIDHETGEITLERLDQSISVKKTRPDTAVSRNRVNGSNGVRSPESRPSPSLPNPPSTASSPAINTLSPPDESVSSRLSESSSSDSSDESDDEEDEEVARNLSNLIVNEVIDGSNQTPLVNEDKGDRESQTSSSSSSSSSDSSSSDDDSDADDMMEVEDAQVLKTSPPFLVNSSLNNNQDSVKSSNGLNPSSKQQPIANSIAQTSAGSSMPIFSMPNLTQLNEDLCLSESGSDSD